MKNEENVDIEPYVSAQLTYKGLSLAHGQDQRTQTKVARLQAIKTDLVGILGKLDSVIDLELLSYI
jgi:hypothetical protein